MVDFEVQFNGITLHPHAVTNSFYSGYTRFEEIKSTGSVERNRAKAYEGSPTHFYRCLVNYSWRKDSFQLLVRGGLTNPVNHFTVYKEEDNFKVLVRKQQFPELKGTNITAVFGLLFDGKFQSSVHFYSDVILIDSFGNILNPRDVAFSGAIQFKRLGDTLPLNYGL